jgi:hypothetical protein
MLFLTCEVSLVLFFDFENPSNDEVLKNFGCQAEV